MENYRLRTGRCTPFTPFPGRLIPLSLNGRASIEAGDLVKPVVRNIRKVCHFRLVILIAFYSLR